MATYRTIASTEVDADSPITSTLMTALADNPIAITQQDTGAPVGAFGWHPYDAVTVGDGNAGLIYDGATDGTVATIETPDFEDGYTYRLFILDISPTLGSNNFQLEMYRETTAGYDTATTVFTALSTATYGYTGQIDMLLPRIARNSHHATATDFVDSNSGAVPSGAATLVSHGAVSEKVLKVRLSWSTGNVDAGKVHLLRRFDHLSV